MSITLPNMVIDILHPESLWDAQDPSKIEKDTPRAKEDTLRAKEVGKATTLIVVIEVGKLVIEFLEDVT